MEGQPPWEESRREGQREDFERQDIQALFALFIMGNVRSLTNKTDELAALVNNQCVYRKCSMLCLTETWQHGNIPDSVINLPG